MDFLKFLWAFWLLTLPTTKILASDYRPSAALDIEVACVCQYGFSLSGKECLSFCRDKATETATLYGLVNVKSRLALRSDLKTQTNHFGNFYNWCYKEINDRNLPPHCVLEARNVSTNETIRMDLNHQSIHHNEFTSAVGSLKRREIYEVRLVEVTSGSSSNAFEIKLD